jgi:hypothetical protein
MQDLELYLEVTKRVQDVAKRTFNCTNLFLTSPTFFSKMDGGLNTWVALGWVCENVSLRGCGRRPKG